MTRCWHAARSLLRVLALRRRHADMLAGMAGPVLLLHGDKDRLVSIESARAAAKANPGWRFEVAKDVGHVPQLEVPDWTAGHIRDWLANHGGGRGRAYKEFLCSRRRTDHQLETHGPAKEHRVKQLSGLDSQFLAMETRSVFGHVGSVCILDPHTAGEEFTLDHLTDAIAERLPLVPLFRRRLVEVPLGLDKAYWIDDPDFDIEFHVRELALPKPGSDRQLSEQVARLHARPLDRRRPLWELYLISGLPRGMVAIYNKIHHAAVDGVSGGDILSALLDLTPEGRPAPESPEPYVGEQPPSSLTLLARSLQSALAQPGQAFQVAADLIRSSPAIAGALRVPLAQLLPDLPGLPGLSGRHDDEDGLLLPGVRSRAPRTPFNANITAHRRWAFTDLPLSEVKSIRAVTGLTVNDVVMACARARCVAGCSTTMRCRRRH